MRGNPTDGQLRACALPQIARCALQCRPQADLRVSPWECSEVNVSVRQQADLWDCRYNHGSYQGWRRYGAMENSKVACLGPASDSASTSANQSARPVTHTGRVALPRQDSPSVGASRTRLTPISMPRI